MANSSSSSGNGGGIGFVGLLTIAFIVLKLTGFIDWSWWWVWSPVWIVAICVVLVLCGTLAFAFWVETKKGRRR